MSEPRKEEMIKEFAFLSGGRLCDAEYAYSKIEIERIKLIHDAIRHLIEQRLEIDEVSVKKICEAMIVARNMGGEMWPILINWLRIWEVRIKEDEGERD